MSLFEDAMSIAVQLPLADRERLAQALGVRPAAVVRPAAGVRRATGQSLPLHQFAARPDPAAWRKAETGHAVLATGDAQAPSQIPAGPAAIAGIWSHRAGEHAPATGGRAAAELAAGSPVVVHTDVCIDLAVGREKAMQFFENPPVEIRLATATYLALLGAAEDAAQQARLRRFVQPYAVLSLGPMASSRAVELMFAHALNDGVEPLDALIAATALAHEIPLVAIDPRPFLRIDGLLACVPYNA